MIYLLFWFFYIYIYIYIVRDLFFPVCNLWEFYSLLIIYFIIISLTIYDGLPSVYATRWPSLDRLRLCLFDFCGSGMKKCLYFYFVLVYSICQDIYYFRKLALTYWLNLSSVCFIWQGSVLFIFAFCSRYLGCYVRLSISRMSCVLVFGWDLLW